MCIVALLATTAFHWPVILYGLAFWFAGALLSLALEMATTSEMKRTTLFDADHIGLLAAWRGLWNGFYVWRDLDEDYWRRSAQTGETEPQAGLNSAERQSDRTTPDA
jgi:4-hydroxybenzoate polyprenyltransferase